MYQLGEIVFEGLKGFDGIQKKDEAVYAELPLIGGKPRLQRTGTALRELQVNIRLLASFTDPDADIAALAALRDAGDILPLITGEGVNLGDFVITQMQETTSETTKSGKTLIAELQLTLKEHFDPNKLQTAATAAVKAAFAVGANKVVPVRLVRPPISTFSVVSQNAQAGKSYSIGTVGDVRTAAADASQAQSRLNQAKAKLDKAKQAYDKVIETANNAQNVIAKAPALIATVTSVLSNIEQLRDAVQNGNLTLALANADILEDSLGAVDNAIRPLNMQLITRGPQ